MNGERATDGLFRKNTVLYSLMVVSPVIVCGNTIKNALALIYVFSAVTFLSVMVSSFVPSKIPYTLRVIIYASVSSLIYIPARIASDMFFPDIAQRIGIYFPLTAVNSLIVIHSEKKFFKMKRTQMAVSLFCHILGFDAVMLVTAFFRELLAYGTINSRMTDIDVLISGLGEPFGGFIFLGLLCGVYRKLSSVSGNKNGGGKNFSDK